MWDRFNPTVLLALMTAEMDDVFVDFPREQVLLGDMMVPFSSLGLRGRLGADVPDVDREAAIIDFEFTVVDVYEKPSGKYG